MKEYKLGPAELVASFLRNRGLIKSLIVREIVGRYRGSMLGMVWAVLHPLLMLGIYTFVFSVVFKAKWGGMSGGKAEFAIVLFCGLILFNLFADCFTRAPNLILGNANYVKKVIFPLEVLSFVSLGAALFNVLIGIAVLVIFMVIAGVGIPWTALYYPLVLIPVCLLCLASSWFLSSLGVYFRDVGQIVTVFITILMFLSPIFFPISAIPPRFQGLIMLNPLAGLIEQARGVFVQGLRPDFLVLGMNSLVSLVLATLAFAWFQKTRRGFADVL